LSFGKLPLPIIALKIRTDRRKQTPGQRFKSVGRDCVGFFHSQNADFLKKFYADNFIRKAILESIFGIIKWNEFTLQQPTGLTKAPILRGSGGSPYQVFRVVWTAGNIACENENYLIQFRIDSTALL